ncbi:MAG: hypothetical protein HY809_08185 [Nitrospirae bacterium]|nr:hypothetical protein [Nitrospirota bacterium]
MMNFKDKIDLAVAIATLLATVFAGVAALFAAKSARDASKAIRMQREAVLAQTFVNILHYEKSIDFSKGMDIIRALKSDECENYPEFYKKQSEKDKQIRQVVDFLNHLTHLIRQGYVEPRHIFPLYSTSIDACRKQLLGKGKWLEGFRVAANSSDYYLNFELLCNNLENLWNSKEIEWPDSSLMASEEMRS